MKKFLVLLFFVILVVGVNATDVKHFSDSLTSNQSDVTVCDVTMDGYKGLNLWFRITQTDTLKNDSLTITLQTGGEWTSQRWNDIISFDEFASDTTTIYRSFNYDVGDIDSLFYYPFQEGARIQIAFTDTNTTDDADSEEVVPVVDTLINGWSLSTGTDHYALVDDGGSDADSSDYVYVLAYGGEDSLEIFGLGDRTKNEAIIDSVVLYFQAEWVTDTGWMAWAVCIGDTGNCTWAQSDTATGSVLTDSATKTYSQTLTTVPGYGTAWSPLMVDSTIVAFFPSLVNSGGQINLYSAWIAVYYEKGRLSPTMKYEVKYKLLD